MRTVLLPAAFLILISTTSTLAFHEPGRSQCSECHTFGSDGKTSPNVTDEKPNPHMLKASKPSDVCLGCHATDNGAVFAADVTNPSPEKGGGNFIFLLEDNLNDLSSDESPGSWISGDAAGHNIDAPDHGISTDMTLAHSPGGDFPSDKLSCTSCHDPHGNENFRLLRGSGPIGKSGKGKYVFANEAPIAEGISLSVGSESNGNHTAYRSGMSEWCANCHGEFHNTSYPAVRRHPTGVALGLAVAGAYNAYNGSSDPAGGLQGNAYLAQVPFEDPGSSNTTSSTTGPTAASKVMCLSCHRAHASSAPDAGRWDFDVTYLDDDGLESGSYPLPNPFGPGQRSLCNKCHLKDDAASVLAASPE